MTAPAAPTGMPFADLMGVEITERGKDRVVGRLTVREDLCTAVQDAAGARTTTLESKTNFLGSAKVGTTVTGEAAPLHIGRRSSVWQTRITSAEGKLLALVTQTQMTVEA